MRRQRKLATNFGYFLLLIHPIPFPFNLDAVAQVVEARAATSGTWQQHLGHLGHLEHGRCEVLGESFLEPSHEIPDEYKGDAEGNENMASKFADKLLCCLTFCSP